MRKFVSVTSVPVIGEDGATSVIMHYAVASDGTFWTATTYPQPGTTTTGWAQCPNLPQD